MKTLTFSFEAAQNRRRRKLNDEGLAAFCGELAVLMSSGLDLVESLKTFLDGEPRRPLKAGIESVVRAIQQGAPFSAAMADCGLGIPQLMIETLRVGETSGRLISALERLEKYYDRLSRQKNKLIQIMIYPAIVLTMAMAVVRYLVTSVLPSLIDTLESLDLSMTAGTRMLISLNGAVADILCALAAALVALWVLHQILPEQTAFRKGLDRLLLESPLFGRMRRLELWAAYLDMLVLALESGVDLITALVVSGKPVTNAYFKSQIDGLPETASHGQPLSEGLAQTGLLDKGGERLIKVGEKSGALLPMLKKAGARCRKQYDRMFARFSAVLEPALIVVVGVLVGCVVISFISLLYTIYGGYAAMM